MIDLMYRCSIAYWSELGQAGILTGIHFARSVKAYPQFCSKKTFVANLHTFKRKSSWPQIAVVSKQDHQREVFQKNGHFS